MVGESVTGRRIGSECLSARYAPRSAHRAASCLVSAWLFCSLKSEAQPVPPARDRASRVSPSDYLSDNAYGLTWTLADSNGQRSAGTRGTDGGYARVALPFGTKRPLAPAVPPRLLPILLPSRWTTLVPSGQLWNVDPAHGQQWTVLDDAPIPTDQMVRGPIGRGGHEDAVERGRAVPGRLACAVVRGTQRPGHVRVGPVHAVPSIGATIGG
jgi:hypothetical protein